MMEFIDYSSRRGAIVPLLPKIHALLKELAEKDKLCGLESPVNITLWKQKINPQLLDVSRRFLFAMEIGGEKREIAGFLFYRCDPREPGKLYIEEMQIAWSCKNKAAAVAGLIAKLETDPGAKTAVFFGSERLRLMADKELLAEVGFRETFPDGWEPLGNIKEAVGSLKLRYNRGKT
jgi:hypothetical protein